MICQQNMLTRERALKEHVDEVLHRMKTWRGNNGISDRETETPTPTLLFILAVTATPTRVKCRGSLPLARSHVAAFFFLYLNEG